MNTSSSNFARTFTLLALAAASLVWSGCATAGVSSASAPAAKVDYPAEAFNGLSPKPILMGAFEPLHRAEAYVKAHPGADYVVGSGDSMLPLYRDHTVLVIEKNQINELKRGMTVVFIGDNGFPVAHTLVRQTANGWVAIGLGNNENDHTLVRSSNYIGTVTQAFEPNENPMVAILHRNNSNVGAIASAD